MKATPLAETLAQRTAEGELYEKLPHGRVRCFACGHRCLIPPGFDGVCRVRFNEDGVLKVPWGYVGALQLDPVEKKPFFHALPGARALSFGMLGCDYHCGYCFTGDTVVVTDEGPATLARLFASCPRTERRPDAELAFPDDRRVVAASGRLRRLGGVVRHHYRGELVTIRPFHLPPLRCTPDHRVYATTDPTLPPLPVHARELSARHFLSIPRSIAGEEHRTLDVAALLRQVRGRVRGDLPAEERGLASVVSAAGETSVGSAFGRDRSYTPPARSRISPGLGEESPARGPIVKGGQVRLSGEPGSGIPASLAIDEDLAALLGYYCANGCIARSRPRPSRHRLNFTFSHQALERAERVRALLKKCLGVEAVLVVRATTLRVTARKTSAALLLKALAGGRRGHKRVPTCIFKAAPERVRAFLDAWVEGSGHRNASGKVSGRTASSALARGIAWLVLRAGCLPSLSTKRTGGVGPIPDRRVRPAPAQYTVAWLADAARGRRAVQATPDNYLVPLRGVEVAAYDGVVYNMEVEEEHNYLAGFFAVSNCQNWVTSQALRDPSAVSRPQEITPQELVRLAGEHQARIVTSTYNEPLITSEWAVAVFREARAAGLVCSYVSNGNGTREVLDYIQPWVSLYKVDLKSFRDRHYRELGGTLDRVLWTIRALRERGFWVEIVTLVVPGFNDSDEELRDIARFLVSVSPDIPWHVTAFHGDYKMTEPGNTRVASLLRASEIGAAEGLRFVYAGNLPGQVGRWENTYCPGCGELLIERYGFRVLRNRVGEGHCPKCARAIPGFWSVPAAGSLGEGAAAPAR
jgi:pyruvate formate lyase activating enzyme